MIAQVTHHDDALDRAVRRFNLKHEALQAVKRYEEEVRVATLLLLSAKARLRHLEREESGNALAR